MRFVEWLRECPDLDPNYKTIIILIQIWLADAMTWSGLPCNLSMRFTPGEHFRNVARALVRAISPENIQALIQELRHFIGNGVELADILEDAFWEERLQHK